MGQGSPGPERLVVLGEHDRDDRLPRVAWASDGEDLDWLRGGIRGHQEADGDVEG